MSALIWPDAGLDEVPLPLSTVIATAAPIAFVGMAGVGKSAVARRVATALGVECIDIDAEVSAVRGGQSVSSIFDEIGEDEFRALETAALLDALDGACNGVRGRARRAVIATGGGVVERQRNLDALRRQALVVWLRSSDDVLADRLRSSSVRRPLLDGDLEANLTRLRTRREPLYRALADIEIDVGSATIPQVVEMVLSRLSAVEDPAQDGEAARDGEAAAVVDEVAGTGAGTGAPR